MQPIYEPEYPVVSIQGVDYSYIEKSTNFSWLKIENNQLVKIDYNPLVKVDYNPLVRV